MFDHLKSTNGMARRHFVTNIIVKKILDAGYYWLILFKDTHDFCRSYNRC
jgi:hypothetical protein